MTPEIWTNCYDDSWRGYITPESFAHPAKMARGLLTRIYERMFKEGWISSGNVIFDPFGGVGTTGIVGAGLGLYVVAVELEEKFVTLARANFELHRTVWKGMGDVMPEMIHGDSRRAAELVRASGIVSSPPFHDSLSTTDAAFMEKMEAEQNPGPRSVARKTKPISYGQTPGQLGAMKEGNVDAAISSPPFLATEGGCKPINGDAALMQRHSATGNERYGSTDGQLGAMPPGDVDAVCSSPPYEGSFNGGEQESAEKVRQDMRRRGCSEKSIAKLTDGSHTSGLGYGTANGQLGQEHGETFWTAARQIVEQCRLLLKPNGVAAWVVKDYVKSRKIVPFADNWRRLCESLGFETVLIVHASLVKEQVHAGLFGDVKTTKARKSFFRRLAESKGSPAINHECVLFTRKP